MDIQARWRSGVTWEEAASPDIVSRPAKNQNTRRGYKMATISPKFPRRDFVSA
jgi:hypothetical protein